MGSSLDAISFSPSDLLLIHRPPLTKGNGMPPVHPQSAAALAPPTPQPHSPCTGRRVLPSAK